MNETLCVVGSERTWAGVISMPADADAAPPSHLLGGFYYDADTGERQTTCTCGWTSLRCANDVAAEEWEAHAQQDM